MSHNRPDLTVIDARDSDGILVKVYGATVTITSSQWMDQVRVVVTVDDPGGYRIKFRWFPALFGGLGQLVSMIARDR